MLTDKMRTAFGYDEMGNAEHLLSDNDKAILETVGVRRAAGTVVCRVCGLEYVRHPPVQGALWLTRTCEGLFKL